MWYKLCISPFISYLVTRKPFYFQNLLHLVAGEVDAVVEVVTADTIDSYKVIINIYYNVAKNTQNINLTSQLFALCFTGSQLKLFIWIMLVIQLPLQVQFYFSRLWPSLMDWLLILRDGWQKFRYVYAIKLSFFFIDHYNLEVFNQVLQWVLWCSQSLYSRPHHFNVANYIVSLGHF